MATTRKKSRQLRQYDYITVYLTYRWICHKFGCTNFIADTLTGRVAAKLLKTGVWSQRHTLGLMCKRYNTYLKKSRGYGLEGEEFTEICDTYHNIVGITFTYLAKHPDIVDELLKKKPTLLNDNMKQLWSLYKKRTYSEEVIRKKLNKNKIAFIAIRHGMFTRLLVTYERLPEFGSYDN